MSMLQNIYKVEIKSRLHCIDICERRLYLFPFIKESILASKGKFNFDHPDAFDNELMEQCLKDIIGGRPTKVNTFFIKETRR